MVGGTDVKCVNQDKIEKCKLEWRFMENELKFSLQNEGTVWAKDIPPLTITSEPSDTFTLKLLLLQSFLRM
jgi:hypothetical protein